MMKKYLMFKFFVVGLTIFAYSQDTTWYSKEFKKVTGRESASIYNVVSRDKTDTNKVKLLSYTKTDTLKMEKNFYPYFPKPVLNGFYREYVEGRLAEERFYKNDMLHGHYKTYRENGLLRRDDLYDNDNFISGKCYGVTGSDTLWFERVKPAMFPGGMDSLRRFIYRHIKYPEIAKATGTEGRVLVAFNIAKDGDLINIVIKESVHPELDKEAIRLVSSMPKWIPGTVEGEPAIFAYRLPVLFRLSE